MLLSPIIKLLLADQGVYFSLLASESEQFNQHNPALMQVAVSFLKDSHGIVVAFYSEGQQLDLSTLKALTDRSGLRFMSIKELEVVLNLLKQKKSISIYRNNGLQLIIEEPISNQDVVLLVTDNPLERIQVDIWDIQITLENALIGGVFSHANDKSYLTTYMNSNLFEQLKNIDHLPVMPSIAAQLLQLQNNPDATVDDMVSIISHDPALTAQVLRYANSAMFGFSGQIANLHDAIFRVLGYETVLYMSLGAALGRAFKLPHSGRLSMETFWKQATHRAALCQQLASRMPADSRPPVALAYITGLLHNIGVVLMGHLFNTEFNWLNKMLSSRPDQSLIKTEQNLFGCTHAAIGQYVMQHWNMPSEITNVAGQHHTYDYKGEDETYVWIAQVAGQVLQSYELSDNDEYSVAEDLYQKLELTEGDVKEAIETVMQDTHALEAMANSLCA